MDTSYFIYEDDVSILIPYPNRQSSGIGVLLKPFQTEVGICMILLYLIYILTSFIHSRFGLAGFVQLFWSPLLLGSPKLLFDAWAEGTLPRDI